MASNPVVVSPAVCLSTVPVREAPTITPAATLEKPVVIVGQTTPEIAIHQAITYWQTRCQKEANANPTDTADTLSDETVEEVSTSITQTWTDQAIKCFLTGANCSRCIIPRSGYAFQCQMNNVVPVLVQQLHAPDITRVDRLLALVHD